MKKEFITHLQKYLSDEDINKLAECQNMPNLNAILLDKEKVDVSEFIKEYPNLIKHPFVDDAFIYDKNVYDFGKSLEFEIGEFYILEPCSLMVNYFLAPKEDELILDACASPGGKTIHASFKMANKGLIIANEMNLSRAYTLSSNIEKYGRKNVIVTNMDLLAMPSRYNNTFDKIILDAPCSGSGMFRKEDKMEEDWTYQKVNKLSILQKKLIIKAYELLKPGGYMIYSTCSFSYEEDEEIIMHLVNNTDAEIIPLENNKMFYPSYKGTIHLFPFLFPGEGHYIAKIHKNATNIINYLSKRKDEKNYTPYNLKGHFYKYNTSLYLLSENYKLDNLKIIRNGLYLGELDAKLGYIPSHALSRFKSDALPYIELNRSEVIEYIQGNTLKKEIKNGYYFLKYNNVPFTLTKINNNTLKNHYPKGLRKTILK